MQAAALVGGLCAGTAVGGAVQNPAPAPELFDRSRFGSSARRQSRHRGSRRARIVCYLRGRCLRRVVQTTDAGLHWRPIFDDQIVASIGAIGVARSDANIVWVGTGEAFIRGNVSIGNGIYKWSTRAKPGRTWGSTRRAASRAWSSIP
jgi:hypothetical protein